MRKRCKRCSGKKMIVGMGAIEKECPKCHGLGFQEEPSDEEINNFLESEQEEVNVAKTKKKVKKKKRKTKTLAELEETL